MLTGRQVDDKNITEAWIVPYDLPTVMEPLRAKIVCATGESRLRIRYPGAAADSFVSQNAAHLDIHDAWRDMHDLLADRRRELQAERQRLDREMQSLEEASARALRLMVPSAQS